MYGLKMETYEIVLTKVRASDFNRVLEILAGHRSFLFCKQRHLNMHQNLINRAHFSGPMLYTIPQYLL